jgi:predicted ester cyclase
MHKIDPNVAVQNKEVVHKLYDECLNRNSTEAAERLLARDFTSSTAKNLEEFIAFMQSLHAAFNRLSFTVADMVAEGDRVAVRWRMNGIHGGSWQGIEPTGKSIEQWANVIYRLQDAKVVEAWPQVDSLGLLQQLGAIPADRFRPHGSDREADK